MPTCDAWILRARRPRVGHHAVLCGVALLLWVGCSRHSTPAPTPPPARPRGNAPAHSTAAAGPTPSLEVQSSPAAAIADTLAPAEKKLDGPAARDLSAELATMMRSAIGCLKPQTGNQAGGPVMISLTANVMPSGAVRHGAVSGSLETEELDCVRRLLETLHFAAPIENAPFSVQASLKLDRPTLANEPVQEATREPDPMALPSDDAPTPGIVPPADPGVVPPADPGVVPPEDPGVVPPSDPGVVPPEDPPASIAGANEAP